MFRALFLEYQLPIVITQRHQAAAIVPVKEFSTGPFFTFTTEVRQKVVSVQVDFEVFSIKIGSSPEAFFDLRIACSRYKCRYPVECRGRIINNGAAFEFCRPAYEHWNAVTALPVGVFFTTEWRKPSVRPLIIVGAIVGGVEHNCILVNFEFFQKVKELTNVTVVLHHAVGKDAKTGNACAFFFQMSVEVHTRSINPGKPGFIVFGVSFDEIHGMAYELIISRFHAFFCQWTGVFTDLLANFAKTWILSLVVLIRSFAIEHTAGTKLCTKLRIFGIVRVLRFFLRIEVIEVAKKLIKPVYRWQVLITVTEVVFTKLPSGITLWFQHLGQRRILFLQTECSTGKANFGKSCADR